MHFWKYGKKYIANLASGTTFIEYITVLGNVPIGTALVLQGKGHWSHWAPQAVVATSDN